MENRIKEILSGKLDELDMFVDSVVYEKEGSNMFLRVCLDSPLVLDLEKIVEATKIIDPIIEKEDIIKEKYILEVYGKSKGSDNNEKEN